MNLSYNLGTRLAQLSIFCLENKKNFRFQQRQCSWPKHGHAFDSNAFEAYFTQDLD